MWWCWRRDGVAREEKEEEESEKMLGRHCDEVCEIVMRGKGRINKDNKYGKGKVNELKWKHELE